MPQLIPNTFTRRGTVGDFNWMINRPEYKDSLFIFNDNVEAFKSRSSAIGRGNAVIRPWQSSTPPRAAGIPTGRRPNNRGRGYGYKSLDDHDARRYIDESIDRIRQLVETGKYSRVFYSAKYDGTLGSSLFKIDESVKVYIVDRLREVVVEK